MPRENKEQIVLRLLAECRRYNLAGLDFLLSHPFNEIVPAYNGIGPESFPNPLRKALDRLSPQILPAVLIHNCRFTFGDGTLEWFRAANDEFEENGIRMANILYRWYDIRRYVVHHRVRAYATMCRLFGWDSFIIACYTTKAKATNPDLADFCFFPKKKIKNPLATIHNILI